MLLTAYFIFLIRYFLENNNSIAIDKFRIDHRTLFAKVTEIKWRVLVVILFNTMVFFSLGKVFLKLETVTPVLTDIKAVFILLS